LLCGSCTNKTLNKSLEFGAANEESFRFDFLQERPDVAMRFLREDPWQRLQQLRAAVPNVLLQMLLRSSNAVGYTNYADNVVRYFVQQAAQQGVDLFRVFDSLNWVDNMRVAIDAVLETGMLCEGAICYTADIHDRTRKYDLASYLKLARELKAAGVHILGLKDMSGVCRPQAARELVHALRHETGLPVHFHTHDTSGISAASVLAAIEAGCDAVDCALDSMSGLTSQPNLGAIVPALEGGPRDPCAGAQGPGRLERESLATLSDYFEGVRKIYAPFESDIRAGTADGYRHEMPGGQYTNLREQARATGLEHRWTEVSRACSDGNRLFGDVIKVSPTSKVVGDMALFMVANDLATADVMDSAREVEFPESVVALFKGEIGFPPDGFPADVSRRILECGRPGEVLAQPAVAYRPGARLAAVDLEAARGEAEKAAAGVDRGDENGIADSRRARPHRAPDPCEAGRYGGRARSVTGIPVAALGRPGGINPPTICAVAHLKSLKRPRRGACRSIAPCHRQPHAAALRISTWTPSTLQSSCCAGPT